MISPSGEIRLIDRDTEERQLFEEAWETLSPTAQRALMHLVNERMTWMMAYEREHTFFVWLAGLSMLAGLSLLIVTVLT